MKKMVILALLSILIIGSVVGCAGTNDLVGTWDADQDGWSFTITFNEDGTGVEAFETWTTEFTWSASNGNLTLEFEDDETEEWSYTIDGDTLTIIEDGEYGEQLVLTRS